MSTLEDKQIAKEILIELIRKDLLTYDNHPDAKDPTELSCHSYKDLLKYF
jgi:hypothetical protein